MSEQKEFTGNPFDPATFVKGGGLWDGKVVTIISAKAKLDPMKNGDGTPVLDNKTGAPIIKHVLEIVGIADDEERERAEKYSAGSLVPTADGEGFVNQQGQHAPYHENSEISKFAAGLAQGGFPVANLYDEASKRTKFSNLVGARIRFKAVARLDKNGNIKKNKKGYDENRFFPVEFVGFKNGAGAAVGGNGAAQGNGADLRDKAVGVVTGLLADNNGSLTRADLVRKVSASLAGDPDSNKILALIVREDFHKGAPWTRNGTTLVLG